METLIDEEMIDVFRLCLFEVFTSLLLFFIVPTAIHLYTDKETGWMAARIGILM